MIAPEIASELDRVLEKSEWLWTMNRVADLH
jgi:hypothetical protein